MDLPKLFGTCFDVLGCSGNGKKRKHEARCINSHNRLCIICGKKVGNRSSIHHITRIPPTRIMVHVLCHMKLEIEEKYKNLKPKYTRKEVNVIKEYQKGKRNRK